MLDPYDVPYDPTSPPGPMSIGAIVNKIGDTIHSKLKSLKLRVTYA